MQSPADTPDHADFIGRLGHELRTPLNAILGFSTLLQRETNLSDRQRERLAIIEQSGRQLLAGIDRLLEHAQISRGSYPMDADGGGPQRAFALPADRSAPALSSMSGCVMVVDDTPANVGLLTEALTAHGLEVMQAASGAEAIALARDRAPDLILLDVQMSGLGGFETCAALKAEAATRDIPVIFTTVISDTATKVAAFDAGAADYVTKPFHIDEVLARVNTQLKLVHGGKQLARLNAELESRVAERTAQLEAANRELQALCSSMAHDLRGPLGALDGFSSLLEGMLKDVTQERARHYLRRIRAGVRQMDALTEALLSLARLGLKEQQDEAVDLGALASQSIERRQAAEPQRQVKVSVEKNLVVEGDRTLLAMLVDQLIDNAWKFSAQSPTTEIAFGRAGRKDGAEAFFVRDNGTGFDMAYADKLFKPFQRLHDGSDYAGVGIGLAMVERIVQRHGGRAWAEATPGDGATIYFTIAAPA